MSLPNYDVEGKEQYQEYEKWIIDNVTKPSWRFRCIYTGIDGFAEDNHKLKAVFMFATKSDAVLFKLTCG